MTLIYPHENTLKGLSLVISVAAWAAALYFSKGLILIYVALFGLVYLFAQSGFISHLKGTGIKVGQAQYPDIFERLKRACETLELERIPDCYVLRTNTFNAVATKFFGSTYVILFADVVETLRDDPDALSFYIGHELGHLKRKHLQWQPFLVPASVVPLLGAGYHRAREYTCDRHGLACSPSATAAELGLVAIATGRSRLATTDVAAYVEQAEASRSFWMSFHELIGDYPWLTKRVLAVRALGAGMDPERPRRNFFAWVLAVFVPRFGVAGGAASPLIGVAMIGILAAIAIPAYQDYTIRAQVAEGLQLAGAYKVAVARAFAQHSGSLQGLDNRTTGIPEHPVANFVASVKVINGAMVITYGGRATVPLASQQLVLVPALTKDSDVVWICGHAPAPDGAEPTVPDYAKYTTVPDKWLPMVCRESSAAR